jgi:hypothetical protein
LLPTILGEMAGQQPALRRDRAPKHLESHRLPLADGRATTLHVATYDPRRVDLRVARVTAPLEAWCLREGVEEAIVGGFFVRGGAHDLVPLGELRTAGMQRHTVPFDEPWGALRACVHASGGTVTIARRPDLPAQPTGDLLQAGPLLVRDGLRVLDGDAEGFSAGSRQFDSDITAGRYPRAALALDRRGRLLAAACDGRADDEAGLSLAELADALIDLGAVDALNLDGGGSTSLVCGGALRNVPREEHGIVLAGGRTIATAIAFVPR